MYVHTVKQYLHQFDGIQAPLAWVPRTIGADEMDIVNCPQKQPQLSEPGEKFFDEVLMTNCKFTSVNYNSYLLEPLHVAPDELAH